VKWVEEGHYTVCEWVFVMTEMNIKVL